MCLVVRRIKAEFQTMTYSTHSYRLIQNLIGVSILFFILGLGNIVYGGYKAGYYADLRDEAISAGVMPDVKSIDEEGLEDDVTQDPLLDQSSIDPVAIKTRQDQSTADYTALEHQTKLRHRLGYYRFSVLGGKCLLLLSIVCSLAALHRHLSAVQQAEDRDLY